jgi:hypothetical protein
MGCSIPPPIHSCVKKHCHSSASGESAERSRDSYEASVSRKLGRMAQRASSKTYKDSNVHLMCTWAEQAVDYAIVVNY